MITKNLFLSYILSVVLTILSVIFIRLRIVGSDPDLIYFGFPIKYVMINLATGEQIISIINILINNLLFLPLAFYLMSDTSKKKLKLALAKQSNANAIFLLKWIFILNFVQIVLNILIPPIIINEMIYSKPTYYVGLGDIFTSVIFFIISSIVFISIYIVYLLKRKLK